MYNVIIKAATYKSPIIIECGSDYGIALDCYNARANNSATFLTSVDCRHEISIEKDGKLINKMVLKSTTIKM